MQRVRLINYFDVWGNEEDGFDVNNMCDEGVVEIDNIDSRNAIVVALINYGFLKPTVTQDMLTFDDYGPDLIELRQKENDCPICRLDFVE